MIGNDIIFNRIAEALLIDYSSIYYVNAVTNEYQWYSIDPNFNSLQIEQGGDDFFKNMARDAEKVVYEEDKHIFQSDIQKDKLISQLKNGNMQSIVYRLMIDGKPVYHTLRLIRGFSENADYFIFGVLNIDKEMRMRQETEKLEQEREIFNQIAGSLAERYDTLCYVNMETNHYLEFSPMDFEKNLQIPSRGDDFFADAKKNIRKNVHPEDLEKVLQLHEKETMLKNLEHQKTFSATYRLLSEGEVVHCRHSEIQASDKKHLIICLENIDAEIIAERVFLENQKNSVTYSQIAESLASQYDVIYYVDLEDGSYTQYTTKNIYGNLQIEEEGHNFFVEAIRNTMELVYHEDQKRILNVLKKDYLLSVLSNRKQYSTDYRLLVDGKPQFTRFTVMWSSDRSHFIIGVENITEEVRREEERKRALKSANEMARRDELTGAKNKNAFSELEESIQRSIDHGIDYLPFAIIICDLNNLKQINDTMGHKAGDAYIISACKMICDIFSHSPVFRIGGDEFAVVLTERDYFERDSLFQKFREQVLENRKKGNAPVIATGMSVYDPEKDHGIADVFERADNMMYDNKKKLKEM